MSERALARTGTLVLAGFALLWAVSGLHVAPAAARIPLLVAATVLTAIVLALGLTRPRPQVTRRLAASWMRRFNQVGAVQGLLIGGVCLVAIPTGHPRLIPTLVLAIVAAHFVPLVAILRQREYLGTALALALVAVGSLVSYVLGMPELAAAVASLGAAVVLWVTALVVTRPVMASSTSPETVSRV
ncbi:hypothetical protein ABT008_26820 [Micromonospora sp. NPDC002389]|uniref:hypothetical protein n=1 Tax=Micromonospora sp. NPDC002389 TaxID=3154272 RepID=UPI003321FD59